MLALLGLAAHASPAQPAPEAAAPGSIRGMVVDREGRVCEGAFISLTLIGIPATTVRTAISDSDGRFNFPGVPAGAFQIAVSSDGFQTQLITGVLHSGENYLAPTVSLLVTAAHSDVQVTTSPLEIAQEQLWQEEAQRVLGFIPNFYVIYAPHPQPLTPGMKFHLAWRSSIDPITILATGAGAGLEQANNSYSGYGQGAQGYAKRFGADYADNFIGGMIGSALLPSLLKQDPRYFYQGTGGFRSRLYHAIESSVMCRSDRGQWQLNYSGIMGSFASAGISNLYYPAANRNGIGLTLENFSIDKGTGAIENIFQEFLARKFTPRLAHYGTSQP